MVIRTQKKKRKGEQWRHPSLSLSQNRMGSFTYILGNITKSLFWTTAIKILLNKNEGFLTSCSEQRKKIKQE